MQTVDIHSDLRQMIIIILGLLQKSDVRRQFAEQTALRYGMVELLDDRVGVYEGGDG